MSEVLMAMKVFSGRKEGGAWQQLVGRNVLPPLSGCKWLPLTRQNTWCYNPKDCDMKILSFPNISD